MKLSRKGFTLVEVLSAILIAGLVLAILSRYIKQIPLFFRRIQISQQSQSNTRTAMDTINRVMRGGKPNTVQICSCNDDWCGGGCTPLPTDPPNSQIDFVTQDGHFHQFRYSSSDSTLRMYDSPTGPPPVNTAYTIVASHVTSIMFTGDPRDLSIIDVSLRTDIPLDNTGLPNVPVITTILPTQSIRLVSAQ